MGSCNVQELIIAEIYQHHNTSRAEVVVPQMQCVRNGMCSEIDARHILKDMHLLPFKQSVRLQLLWGKGDNARVCLWCQCDGPFACMTVRSRQRGPLFVLVSITVSRSGCVCSCLSFSITVRPSTLEPVAGLSGTAGGTSKSGVVISSFISGSRWLVPVCISRACVLPCVCPKCLE